MSLKVRYKHIQNTEIWYLNLLSLDDARLGIPLQKFFLARCVFKKYITYRIKFC